MPFQNRPLALRDKRIEGLARRVCARIGVDIAGRAEAIRGAAWGAHDGIAVVVLQSRPRLILGIVNTNSFCGVHGDAARPLFRSRLHHAHFRGKRA